MQCSRIYGQTIFAIMLTALVAVCDCWRLRVKSDSVAHLTSDRRTRLGPGKPAVCKPC